ncbi:MAG: tetratricopeptide repeat protein [Cyanophyceae cyanobacterium]
MAQSLRQQGLEYRQQGRYAEAIAALKQSTELEPQNLSGRVILGWTLHLNKQHEEAVQELQAALESDPDDVPALNALGIVYLVSGDLPAAVETHTRATELEANNDIAHYNLSLAYHRLQQYDQAIAQGQRSATLAPNNPHHWVALAIAQWDRGDQEAAVQAYQQAINLDARYRTSEFLAHLEQAGFSQEQIQTTEQVRQAI